MSLRRTFFSVASLLLATTLTGLWPGSAQAHVLESDGDVAAVLHIPPDDAPVAEQLTTLGLAFASGRADFDLHNYEVRLIVKQDTTTVLTTLVNPDDGSSHDGNAEVTFPQAGAYRLEVEGKPLHDERAFRLEFSVRAALPPNSATDTTRLGGVTIDFWIINVGIWAVLILIAQYGIRTGIRYNQPPTVDKIRKPSRKTPVQQ